mmetsp:Transcript_106536/g.308326  ORF Transcript_106536/g.308326 Transcript_106536/m.308326 type:complete len:395 (-) Transcript_106536:92-1276(-)
MRSVKRSSSQLPFKVSLRSLVFASYSLLVFAFVAFNMSVVSELESSLNTGDDHDKRGKKNKKKKGKKNKQPEGEEVIPGIRIVPIEEGKRRRIHIVDKEAEIAKYGKAELVFLNRTREEPELKSCLDPDGPKPVILMSLGRSGSTAIWQIMGNLTGEETDSKEYTGGTRGSSFAFFEGKEGYEWMTEYLCEEQKKYPDAGIVGFKWKPYESMESEAAMEALRNMAKLGVKVVRNKRNELDVILSWRKHDAMDKALGDKKTAHCVLGAWRCLQMHFSFAKDTKLGIKGLLRKLQELREREQKTDKLLYQLGVPVASVSYDKLFASYDATEWMRIFRFLGVGPVNGLTMEHVREAMILLPTYIRDHRQSIKNFDAVEKALRGTEFERLLRKDLAKQ